MADNKFYNELAFNNKLFIEYFGNPVEIESNVDNIKITTPADFYTFKALYEVRENQQIFGLYK